MCPELFCFPLVTYSVVEVQRSWDQLPFPVPSVQILTLPGVCVCVFILVFEGHLKPASYNNKIMTQTQCWWRWMKKMELTKGTCAFTPYVSKLTNTSVLSIGFVEEWKFCSVGKLTTPFLMDVFKRQRGHLTLQFPPGRQSITRRHRPILHTFPLFGLSVFSHGEERLGLDSP